MTIALSVYTTNTNDALLTTARILATATGAASTTPINTLCGTSSGFSELFSQGTGAAWSAAGAIGSPSGNGFLLDSTVLEAQQIIAGNWTPMIRAKVSVGTVVANLYMRAFVRHSGGTYTQIGSTMSLNTLTITTTAQNFTFAATSQPAQNFSAGDKLYIDVWADITTNSTGSGTATFSIVEAISSTLGHANATQTSTPGYQPNGPALATSPASLTFNATVGGLNPASQNDLLSEINDVATAWTSSISYGVGSGWLSISPTSGSLVANGNVNVVFSCTTGALTAGTYTATVTFTATTGGATAAVSVTFNVNTPATPYVRAVLADAPLAYYRLDEQYGTEAFDATGNGYNGTIIGNIAYDAVGALVGDSDPAMGFDGASGSIACPSALSLNGLTAFSIEFLIWPNTTFAQFGRVVASDNVGTNKKGFQVGVQPNAAGLFFAIGNGTTTFEVDYNTALPTNRYTHVVAVWNGSTLFLYVNGTLAASIAAATTLANATFALNIGRSPDVSNYYPGLADEVSIYNFALSGTRITAHYNAATTFVALASPVSQEDMSVYKAQQVLVFAPNGTTFLGVWPDAPLLAGFKEAINAATTALQVELPRAFDNFDLVNSIGSGGTVGQGNIVQYWLYGPGLPREGLLRFQGRIDGYAPQIKDTGEETVTVTLTPMSAVIGDSAFAGTLFYGTPNIPSSYSDPVSMFGYWFQTTDLNTGHFYAYPLTLASGNPGSSGRSTQYTFQNQNLLSIMQTILLMLPPNWFFRPNPDNTVVLNASPTTAQHTLDIAQHLVNPQYAIDWTQLKNIVYFTGKSQASPANPSVQVPVVSMTVAGSDTASFGGRYQFANDSRVTDANTAYVLAIGLLDALDKFTLRTKIRVPDYRGDIAQNIGYDIESFRVGDTLQLVDTAGAPSSSSFQSLWDQAQWDVQSWDSALSAVISPVVQIVSIDYQWYYVDLELSALQPNQDFQLFQIRQRFQDFTMV